MKNEILMDEYIALRGYSLRLQNFQMFHIYEEIRHSKCHPGSCTRIPYLLILENHYKLHQKSTNFFDQ